MPYRLIASILYGSGLRLNEVLRLRVKDIDFSNQTIFIFRGKGQQDRLTILPKELNEIITHQINQVEAIHKQDLLDGFGLTSVPASLHRKYKAAMKDFLIPFLYSLRTSYRWIYLSPSYSSININSPFATSGHKSKDQ
ncbi:tyrosine-type recombinase/integrase [Psychromonas sp. GE-S-Ul-11]|jgi:integrase|uniref:tyrosine-type recombinase/integrase n=1 Tax=unclassified Psychromonas TaxID=2614957 RepID=UPI00390CBBBF